MTKDEAVSHGETYVRRRYPIVPQVWMVQHVTERRFENGHQLHVESWMPFLTATGPHPSVALADMADIPGEEFSTVIGRWIVAFRMSWDTDEAGMPQTLVVSVDDLDASVTQLSPE